MPAEELLTPLGQEWRAGLPTRLRNSPDHLAVIHAVACEMERLEEKIVQVGRQAFPQTADCLLGAHERQLGLTVAPEGQTLTQRRATVIAMRRKQRSSPSGRDWESDVTRLVGPGWSYVEHNPLDPTSPPEYTVRVRLPYPPASGLYHQIARLLADITPAHLAIQVQYAGGFVLDASQLDLEGLA